MKVAHIIDSLKGIRLSFIRTILSNPKQPGIEYYVFLDTGFKNLTNDFYNQYLLKDKQLAYYQTETELFKLINKYQPDVVILTVKPQEAFVGQLVRNYRLCPIYYVHHGIFGGNTPKLVWSKKLTKIIAPSPIGAKLMSSKGHQTHVLRGLPQFEHLVNNRQAIMNYKTELYQQFNLSPSCLSILLIGPSNRSYFKTTSLIEIKGIKKILDDLNIDYHIFFKFKEKGLVDLHNFIEQSPTLTEIDYSEQFYKFLCCDLVIVQDSCTSAVESLLINDKTITISDVNRKMLQKYPELFSIDSVNQLTHILKKLTNPDFQLTESYFRQRKEYLDYFSAQSENASENIFQLISSTKIE